MKPKKLIITKNTHRVITTETTYKLTKCCCDTLDECLSTGIAQVNSLNGALSFVSTPKWDFKNCPFCGTDITIQKKKGKPIEENISDVIPFVHDGWTLYKRDVTLKGGRSQVIYFFSRRTPRSGTPCAMPKNMVVGVNQRTGLPYLRRTNNEMDTFI